MVKKPLSADQRLISTDFPRASRYHPDWVMAAISGGANSLWLCEWLAGAMSLAPGMRVLDLGCGRAASSIFLQREFGVQVWATDLWFDASENLQRVRDAGAEGGVFPIHADARNLPFAAGFFDAILSIDSFVYYGTDDLYLGYLGRFLKPGGQLGIAGAGLMREIEGELPAHLRAWWEPALWCLHSPGWWRRHWERTGIIQVETADAMPDGWRRWLDWQHTVSPDNAAEIQALEADKGKYLGYVRAVGRRAELALDPPLLSIPTQYEPRPLLRDQADAALANGDSPLPASIGRPATRALAQLGVTQLHQLTDHREEELLALHGFGPKALRILKEALQGEGLTLKV